MRMEFSVRLNCTSDVNWSEIKINGKNMIVKTNDQKYGHIVLNVLVGSVP